MKMEMLMAMMVMIIIFIVEGLGLVELLKIFYFQCVLCDAFIFCVKKSENNFLLERIEVIRRMRPE